MMPKNIFSMNYYGSSFIDVLQNSQKMPGNPFQEYNTSNTSQNKISVPHGTTILSIKYRDGVIIAGDRRATEGLHIADRRIRKVYKTDNFSAIAIAGAAGPCIEMSRLFAVELEHYEKIEGRELSMDGKANKLSQMIKANLPMAMQGLAVVPIYAGYDKAKKIGRIFRFDITGGKYEEVSYHATGSGGRDATGTIKRSFKSDLDSETAVGISLEALFDAAEEDAGTGGPDLMREIFPIVAIIDKDGVREKADEEIKEYYQSMIERKRS